MAKKSKELSNLEEWEFIRDMEPVETFGKAPDDTMIGFVPLLPARRDLVFSSTSSRPTYPRHYAANYYSLRDTIERDQYDRRGGYRDPYEYELTLYTLYVFSDDDAPLHSKYRSRYDLDNCDKTFIDALSTTTRKTINGTRYRHIRDDSLIYRHYSEKRRARKGEMCGVWYALKRTNFDTHPILEILRLMRLVSREQRRQRRRRTFDLANLQIAKRAGGIFLRNDEDIIQHQDELRTLKKIANHTVAIGDAQSHLSASDAPASQKECHSKRRKQSAPEMESPRKRRWSGLAHTNKHS